MTNLNSKPAVASGIVLLVFYFLLTGWDLPSREIVGPDEPRYATAARTMIRGGDWIIPEFNGRPRLAKPIFFIGSSPAQAQSANAWDSI
jgi:4-amino-4-deoxy-L-arabinose transferase-like glycosyltransferase